MGSAYNQGRQVIIMMSRTIPILALLALTAASARANNPSVGVYGDLAGASQQVQAVPFVEGQVYVLAFDYPPFRGYGIGLFADPAVTVTGVTPYWSDVGGSGSPVDPEDLHCAANVCVDDPSPLRLFLVSFVVLEPGPDRTICAGAPTNSTLSPPAPYCTPCTPVNTYPADLAPSPFGDGCVGITTSTVSTEKLNWGSLKGRFE